MKTPNFVTMLHPARLVGLLGIAMFVGLTGLAAQAGKPPTPTPSPDIAYVSLTGGGMGSWWKTAAVRGISVDAAGQSSADVELSKAAMRLVAAITWDPAGQNLFWEQEVDRKGTRGIVMTSLGGTPRVLFVSSSTGLYLASMNDVLASGPGCGSTPVLYFWGVVAGTNWPTMWVLDPFAASPQPREVYSPDGPPPDDKGGSLQGFAISPLGRQLVFGGYSYQVSSRAILALPLMCSAADALPAAAGPPQPLFTARTENDKAWIQSFDWSRDGHRLAVAMGRWVETPGGGLVYDPELWVAELDYLAAGGAEQISLATLTHVASGAVGYPSWAPSIGTATCDRLAFSRSGSLWLLDVPRDGVPAGSCTFPVPGAIGGQSAAALDWK